MGMLVARVEELDPVARHAVVAYFAASKLQSLGLYIERARIAAGG